MLTEKDISNIKVTWKTLTFPEIKSRLQELYHSDMPLVDLISALYWDLIETKQKTKATRSENNNVYRQRT